MNKGGIIIRLIDVAMIILFGFIAISDIKVRAQIRLPSEDQEQPETQEEPEVMYVRIEPERGFVIEQNEVALVVTREITELETALVNLYDFHKNNGSQMVVLVEPDENSIIQNTVDVLDICEREKIPMNINYESMQF